MNELETGMVESISTLDFTFDIIALILVDVVLAFIIYKTITKTTPCSFNTDSPTFARKMVSNIKAWNKEHAIGYIIYGAAINLVFLYPMVGLQIDGNYIDGIIFFGTLVLGFLGLLINHNRLIKKYVVDRTEYADYE